MIAFSRYPFRITTGLALVSCLVALLGATVAQARDLSVRGTEMKGFGRIALAFDRPTKVSVRNAGGVLVLSFSDKTAIRAERLAAELPAYVASVRRDPDGGAIRIALGRVYKTNVLDAGEKVFVDLLPETWSGLPPPLPQDVVDDLARRAQEAEAKLRQEAQKREQPVPKGTVRVAQLPTLLRVAFQLPASVPVSMEEKGAQVRLLLGSPVAFDAEEARRRLGPAVKSMTIETGKSEPRVTLVLADGYRAAGFREDDGFVVDISNPSSSALRDAIPGSGPVQPSVPPAVSSTARAPAEPPPVDKRPVPPPEKAAAPPSNVPPQISKGSPPPSLPAAPPVAPGTPVRPRIAANLERLSLTFRFPERTAAAVFERSGTVTAVFESKERVELPPTLAQEAGRFIASSSVKREGSFVVVRLALARNDLVQLVSTPAGEWVIVLGDGADAAPRPLTPGRMPDESGRAALSLPLAGASGVHWLEERNPDGAGERIAVVTAFDPPSGLVKPQRFQEFRLLPSAHGVALVADSDDLTVRLKPDRVIVSRPTGLSVSLDAKSESAGPGRELAVDAKRWNEDKGGPVLANFRERLNTVADAPRSQRAPLRLALARFLLANALAPEASTVLSVALEDDPGLGRQKPIVLLQGILALRTGRDSEARRLLGADLLSSDPEAALWLAAADVKAHRWSQASAGFRRAASVLASYPDELQAELRSLAAEAALEEKDFPAAEAAIGAADQSADSPAARSRLALLQARLDGSLGRVAAAVESFKRLAENAEPSIAAEATLGWVQTALDGRSMSAAEATNRLETLALSWRGGDIEASTIARLGRLYAESGRWRDAFGMTRLANRIFPDHQSTRELHDETARLFEDLFLSGKGEGLPRVEAVALYFDFKEFTPIGRVGDEIVRRLADRLADLDLLDEAGDLLQHQVDKRLSGAARATVATRLAGVRLMAGKPQGALAVLKATWLPELPSAIKRARLLLEARALSDLSRTDLALETLTGESGPEIDRLRADIVWTARRWREAGEAHEGILGAKWRGPEPLTDQDRADATRAALAYSQGGESLALDRLRTRFGTKMRDGGDSRAFALLTEGGPPGGAQAGLAQEGATRADTLAEFLREYRQRYPDSAPKESGRTPLTAAPSGPGGRG